jgi:tripartite-type tricarboxylate transporter receptor subunit TctC
MRLRRTIPSALLLTLAMALTACGGSSDSGSGGAYPNRPVTLIVPFAAGGPADVTARLYAQFASDKFGEKVTVQNVTGASGITGALQAIKASPDGYTLFVDSQGTSATLAATFSSVPFALDQRTYISELAEAGQFYVVNSKSKFDTLKDLMDSAKADPEGFSWAAAAAGSSVEYGILQLLHAAGVDIAKTRKTVEQEGLAAASAAVASGEVQFSLLSYSEASSLQAAGKVKILAVAADERDPAAPDVPTTAELGYQGADMFLFQALAGPPKLAQSVTDAWLPVIKAAAEDPEMIASAKKIGNRLSSDRNGQDMADYVKKEYDEILPLAVSSGTRQ